MGARGRKSSASMDIATVGAVEAIHRPDAPYDLTDEQAEEWWAVVNAKEASWFTRETHAMLSQYCRHVVRARKLAQLINAIEQSTEFDVKEYRDLLRSEEEQSRAISSLATKMRISHQATESPRVKRTVAMKRPWEA